MNIIEAALAGPIFTGESLALDYLDQLNISGFNVKAFKSQACAEVWKKATELRAEGTFTREKLLDHCLKSHWFGPTPYDKSIAVSEIVKHGIAFSMNEHAAILMNRLAAEDVREALAHVETDPDSIDIDGIEGKISEIRSRQLTKAVNEKEAACAELLEEMAALQRGENSMPMTGVQVWDQVLGGLPPAQLIVVAGRPGGGKTSLSEQIIDAGVRNGTPVLYIQKELSRSRAVGRLAARKAGVPWSKVEMRKLSQPEISRLQRSIGEYEKLPLYLAPAASSTTANIASLVRFHAKQNRVRFVVFDYVQLVTVPKGMERRNVIGDITRALKLVANETGVTVIAIAQLSREAERSETKPTLSHLKESGDIEQDADVVLALWNSEDRAERSRWPVNWSILKNRNGPQGTVEVMFDGPEMSFLGRQINRGEE